jgi:hypothetical protein
MTYGRGTTLLQRPYHQKFISADCRDIFPSMLGSADVHSQDAFAMEVGLGKFLDSKGGVSLGTPFETGKTSSFGC